MTVTLLTDVDGSAMLPLTAEILSALSLSTDSSVEMSVKDGQLIVQAPARAKRQQRSRYKLSELLADYDKMPRNEEEDREWLNTPRVGRELL